MQVDSNNGTMKRIKTLGIAEISVVSNPGWLLHNIELNECKRNLHTMRVYNNYRLSQISTC